MNFFELKNYSEQRVLPKLLREGNQNFTEEMTLLELMNRFDAKNKMLTDIDNRLEIAPVKIICLGNILAEYDEYETPLTAYTYVADMGFDRTLEPKEWPAKYLAYQMIKNGINGTVKDFAHHFVSSDSNNQWSLNIFPHVELQDMAFGAAMAYVYPILKTKLKELNDDIHPPLSKPSSELKKVKWFGKPSHFGTLIQLLTEAGYIEVPGASLTAQAENLMMIFDINTTIGTLEKQLSPTPGQNATSAENKTLFRILPNPRIK